MATGHMLVVGCGYLGARVARHWHADGNTVWVLTRSAERANEMEREGWRPLIGDITEPDTLPEFPPCRNVLFAVGYDRRRYTDIRTVYVQGLKQLVPRLSPGTERFLYISSTGVYGQGAGEWVDEESPTAPDRPGGQACLEAEQWLASSPVAPSTIILRLAGLYGPGRLPRLEELRAGPIAACENGWVNLIHIEDAARVVCAAARHVVPPQRLVVSDGHPVHRGDYLRYLAGLYQIPPPTFRAVAEGESAGRRGTAEGKRIRSRYLADRCPITLQYPSYREGLAQATSGGSVEARTNRP
ncbi:MAG: SDR family oxidoreductase [Pirellulales bacterium]